MSTPNPSIFRKEAIDYRLQHRGTRSTEISFPRLMAARVSRTLWVALVLLAFGTIVACLPTVPVTANGFAIVTSTTSDGSDAPVVAVLLQDDYREEIVPGRGVDILLSVDGDSTHGTITEVDPQPMTPTDVAKHLGLPGAALSMIEGSVTLVWVALDGVDHESIGVNTIGQANVEIGTTPAGSFLPLVGRFFED